MGSDTVNDDLSAQLRLIFREEAAELLGELRRILGLLRGADRAHVETLVASALRFAHNLKGAAGNVGLADTERTAHALEDAFLKLRTLDAAALAEALPLLGAAISAIELAAEGQGEALAASQETLLRQWVGLPAVERAKKAPADSARTHETQQPPPVQTPQQTPREPHDGAQQAAVDPHKARTIRIEADRLDRLSESVSALLVTGTDLHRRSGLLEKFRERLEHHAAVDELERNRSHAALVRTLDTLIEEQRQGLGAFTRLSQDLHAAMKRVRLVPLDSLTASLQRSVDEAARVLHKTVDLELQFSDVELDKPVLDGLRDPLMHLLRNAVDHGLEAVDTRDLLGKPERGLIRVSAEVVGNSVRVVVADDGRGIDLQGVARTAVARGLASAAQAARFDDESVLALIFAEGFSTRTETTQVSGRGVGLDVVKRAAAELGGSVRASIRGPLGGAAFTLVVPLSLLSTRLLLVTADDQVYALPAESVERVTRVPKLALHIVQGMHMARLNASESLRVIWLSSALSGRPARESEHVNLVVCTDADTRFALVVDEVVQTEELTVRRLPWNFAAIPGVTGAVVLADGNVAVVADAAYLAAGRHAKVVETEHAREGQRRVLVVDDSMTTRTLHRNVLSFAGYQVTTAHDGNHAWELLQQMEFDALVSDVQMPGLDGFELTRKVRATPHLRQLKVILVTSLDAAEDMQRGHAAGADEYVVKGPLERDALLSAVSKQLHA